MTLSAWFWILLLLNIVVEGVSWWRDDIWVRRGGGLLFILLLVVIGFLIAGSPVK